METILKKHWHNLKIDEAAELLGTDLRNALNLFEITQRKWIRRTAWEN